MRSALTALGAASSPALRGEAAGGAAQQSRQEYYQLRTYTLRNGPQPRLLEDYLERALIPALNRLRMEPVGAFKLDVGPETPTYYVVIPSHSVEALATLDDGLRGDAAYAGAAAAFLGAPASAPAFVREERALLAAFAGWPKLVAPKHEKRVFQLRTYESPGEDAHRRKVQMFNEAEIGIFARSGLAPVFFGDTLIGPRMPSLIYMLTFPSMAELTAHWAAFSADPEWKELSHRPGNTDPDIVNNISNLYLSPLSSSQI